MKSVNFTVFGVLVAVFLALVARPVYAQSVPGFPSTDPTATTDSSSASSELLDPNSADFSNDLFFNDFVDNSVTQDTSSADPSDPTAITTDNASTTDSSTGTSSATGDTNTSTSSNGNDAISTSATDNTTDVTDTTTTVVKDTPTGADTSTMALLAFGFSFIFFALARKALYQPKERFYE